MMEVLADTMPTGTHVPTLSPTSLEPTPFSSSAPTSTGGYPVVVEAKDYADAEGYALQGFLSLPDVTPAPVVIVLPDWNGVNLYEKQRATMLAEMGYVAFAADIFGPDNHFVEEFSRRIALATLYRTNSTLFVQRIKAAVDFVKTLDEVESDNIGIIGYCFGGTGAIMYAMSGADDVKGIVSFHGGLLDFETGPAVQAKLLVLSGGDDDTSTQIIDLENTLTNVSAPWEITRYSGIEHGFTVFGDDRYNALADERSWESMSSFLAEAFGLISYDGMQPDALDVTAVNYTGVDGTSLTGYISFPEATPSPAVIIIPDWDGVNEYEKERATLLADLGYVAFAADIYGSDLQEGLDFSTRIQQAGLYRGDPALFIQRIQTAIDVVKSYPEVDSSSIALVGYCFGGTGVLEYAYTDGDDAVKVVASFHGGHQSLPRPMTAIKPYVMILSGGIDDAHGNQTLMEDAFNERNASWEITRYAGVDHGYTSWNGGAYNLVADARSFESMMEVLADTMPTGTHVPTLSPTSLEPTPFSSSAPTSTGGYPVVVEAKDYADAEGYALQGFLSLPDVTPAPVVIVLPDWNGVNLYEKQRATMLAEMGYVAFAADIFGPDNHFVEEFSRRIALATLYRTNSTLFVQRIKAAVDFVKTLDEVESDNIGIIGYCFGGTGAIMYAMSGADDVKGIVSFHGGLLDFETGPAVQAKLLVLSGGDDDTSTQIIDLENTLTNVSAPWEITRYSGIEHGFTVFGDDRYNALADERSWESMSSFLAEAFGLISYDGMQPDALDVTAVNYTGVDGTSLTGYISFPEATPSPAVIIIPDWDGVNEYEKERATLLADLGYVAFAADIYGSDLQEGLDFSTRIQQAGLYRGDPALFIQRIQTAIDVVKSYPEVDSSSIALVGYCFGGTGVLEYAYTDGDDAVKVVASFHGGHQSLPRPMTAIKPYVMILSGGIDDAHGNQTLMEDAFNERNASWEITRYAGVDHGYTSWNGGAYNLVADARSFESMMEVLADTMPVGSSAPSSSPTVSLMPSSEVADASVIDLEERDGGLSSGGVVVLIIGAFIGGLVVAGVAFYMRLDHGGPN
eukprot:CAMPEP_0118725752 /NCGR_PEP_ID=MMETSP0800-20121206/33314_1 /TAXON_ID=210618 ORGANISM="Striatella unipunctata, Strain CCMP2910" /NCGR_SAMPLE_ID=MMETSP0800 /ASSEMBLY_ACC=CAM_ASM_000638 /LENGTH=1077 /DNA_ID=CAMNT_0006634485 /DNA_START=1 /DNA_END=3234 /DNA_ORIENTATION=+